jgi:hypothetical protein
MGSMGKMMRVIAGSTAIGAVMMGGAFAQDVDGALDRLQALVAAQGATIAWSDARIAGDDVTLVGVTLGDADETLAIGDVELTGVSQIDRGYRIDEILLPSYFLSQDGSDVRIDNLSMTGVILPAEGETAAYGGFLFYETAQMARLAVNVSGSEVFTLDNLLVEATEPTDTDPLTFTGAADGFTIDFSTMENRQQVAVLEALGYAQMSGTFQMAGSWQPTDGRMTLSQYDLTVADAGTLGFTFDIGGYTTQFMDALRQASENMSEDGDNAAQGMAMLGLMQQLTLHGLEISFGDDGLTNKVLGYMADQQGVRPADVANQAKALLPFGLMQLNNQQLTQMVTSAVSSFLDDPQSLTISASPANPVPFALVMAGAMTAPQTLPDTIGLTVRAND